MLKHTLMLFHDLTRTDRAVAKDLQKLDYASPARPADAGPPPRFGAAAAGLIGANAFGGFCLAAVGVLYLADFPVQGALLLAAGVTLCVATLRALGRTPPRFGRALSLVAVAVACLAAAGVMAHLRVGQVAAEPDDLPAALRYSRRREAAAASRYPFLELASFAGAGAGSVLLIYLVVRLGGRGHDVP